MALYRTERRLSWNHALRIGHWYAPWSETQADTGTDCFSRTLRWLRNTYPKAAIASDSHALPAANTSWPQERFGLPLNTPEQSTTGVDPSDFDATNTSATAADAVLEQPAHAGDLLLIEWPQPLPANDEAPAEAPQPNALPPLWVNGLERALRRVWQDNPLAEVIFIGGATPICTSGLALAAHYGITVLDPAALLHPGNTTGTDHRKAFIHEGKTGTPATLTPQGQEIWAGMLISLLREQLRYGPTPDPVNLPDGLWSRS